jgi:hypothetical protein
MAAWCVLAVMDLLPSEPTLEEAAHARLPSAFFPLQGLGGENQLQAIVLPQRKDPSIALQNCGPFCANDAQERTSNQVASTFFVYWIVKAACIRQGASTGVWSCRAKDMRLADKT